MSSNSSKLAATVLPDEEYNRKWAEEGNYQMVRKSHDPRFGEIIIYKRRGTNDLIFAKEKLTTSKQSAAADIRELKSRIAFNRPGLQRMLGYSTAVKKELCSTSYLTQGFYEFPKSDLSKEIGVRAQNGQSFSEQELQQVASQALQGLNSLHQEKITHGDIRPQYLGVSHANGHTEILDRLADPAPLEKTQTSHLVNKKNLYQSPELYKRLQGKDKLVKYDPAKNDLYALGLSILEAGNGQSIQDIYNANGTLNQQNLDRHLQTFNSKYRGGYLSNFLGHTLHPNEASRLTSNDLLSSLSSATHPVGDLYGQSHLGGQAQYANLGTAQYGQQSQAPLQQSQYGNQSLFDQTAAYTSQTQAYPAQVVTQTTTNTYGYVEAPVAANTQSYTQQSQAVHPGHQTHHGHEGHQLHQGLDVNQGQQGSQAHHDQTSQSNHPHLDKLKNTAQNVAHSVAQTLHLSHKDNKDQKEAEKQGQFDQTQHHHDHQGVHGQVQNLASHLHQSHPHHQHADHSKLNVTNTTAPSFLQQETLEAYNVEASRNEAYTNAFNQPSKTVHSSDASLLTNTTQPAINQSYNYAQNANFQKQPETQIVYGNQQPTTIVYANPQQSVSYPLTQSHTSHASHPSTFQSFANPSYNTTQSFVIPATAPVTTSHTYAVPNIVNATPLSGSTVSYSSRVVQPTTQYYTTRPSQQYVSSYPISQGHSTTYVTSSPAPLGSQTHLITEGAPYVSNYVQNQPVVISSSPQYTSIIDNSRSRPLTPALGTHYTGAQVQSIRPLTPTHNRPSQTFSTTYLTSQPNIVTYAQPSSFTTASPFISFGQSKSERVVPSTEIHTTGGLSGYYQPSTAFQTSRTEIVQPLNELRTRKSVSFVNHDDSRGGLTHLAGSTAFAKPIDGGLSQTYTLGQSGIQNYTTSHRVLGAETNTLSHGLTATGSHRQTISFEEFQALKNRDPTVKLIETQAAGHQSSNQDNAQVISLGNAYASNQEYGHAVNQEHHQAESQVIHADHQNKYSDNYSNSGSKQIANLVRQADTQQSNTLQNDRTYSFQNEQNTQNNQAQSHRQSDEQNYVHEYSYANDHQALQGHQGQSFGQSGSHQVHAESSSAYDHGSQQYSHQKNAGYESAQNYESGTKYYSSNQNQGEGGLSAYGQTNGPRLSYSTNPEQVSQSSRVSRRYRLENGQRIEITDDNAGHRF